MIQQAARLLPAVLRRPAAEAWCSWTSAAVSRELARIARGRRPVVVGPWLGEVGFELLYWVPFLDWAVEHFDIDRRRLLVVSRGGTRDWYCHITANYRDVFEFLSPDEFRARNLARCEEVGEQKQVRPTGLERDIATRAAQAAGLDDPMMLHPALMYRAFNPFWWGYQGDTWVKRHARFRRLAAADAALRPSGLPERYVAVKFYYNDAFPATSENRATAARIVRELACEGPTVSLATGLRIDDHHGWEEEEHHSLRGIRAVSPATNLGVQSAIVAGASAWVGTYGGFAYLAPFHGVPALAFYSKPSGFSRRHLHLAESVFGTFGRDLLSLSDVRDVPRAAAAVP